MLEPPDISPEALLAELRARYGLPAEALTFLPLGRDAAAWAYRVRAAGADCFLKVRRGMSTGAPLDEQALLVPRHLADQGLSHVIAPLRAADGALWVELGDYQLILYPYVEARQAAHAGMTREQWRTYGAALCQIHGSTLVPEMAGGLRREHFSPEWAPVVRRLDAHIAMRSFDEPERQELARFWQERRAQIRALLERAEALGRRLRASDPPLVLCHADIHTWNVLLDGEGRLWVVDWDEALLAPRECDLMFVVGGIGAGLVGSREESWFFEGYGTVELDPLALAYYRYVRAVGDIGGYGQTVLLQADAGPQTRRDALEGLLLQFEPGNIVAIAEGSEKLL